MGRPPLGKSAMSNTERSRRWRELRGKASNETRNETRNETVAELEARVAELEALLALPAKAVWMRLKETVAETRALRRDAKKQARAEISKETNEEITALKARLERFVSNPDTVYAERITDLEKQIKGARTQIKNLKQYTRHLESKSTLTLTKVEFNMLRKALHPDAKFNEETLNKAAALFNALIDAKRIQVEIEPR
jgi:hypothetical protein